MGSVHLLIIDEWYGAKPLRYGYYYNNGGRTECRTGKWQSSFCCIQVDRRWARL